MKPILDSSPLLLSHVLYLGLGWRDVRGREEGQERLYADSNSAVSQLRQWPSPFLKLERSTDHDALSKQHVKIKDKSSRCSHPDLVVGCILSHIVSVGAVFGGQATRPKRQ
jgi:hypothetical protein